MSSAQMPSRNSPSRSRGTHRSVVVGWSRATRRVRAQQERGRSLSRASCLAARDRKPKSRERPAAIRSAAQASGPAPARARTRARSRITESWAGRAGSSSARKRLTASSRSPRRSAHWASTRVPRGVCSRAARWPARAPWKAAASSRPVRSRWASRAVPRALEARGWARQSSSRNPAVSGAVRSRAPSSHRATSGVRPPGPGSGGWSIRRGPRGSAGCRRRYAAGPPGRW